MDSEGIVLRKGGKFCFCYDQFNGEKKVEKPLEKRKKVKET